MNYWRREGKEERLFFAQLEAAETIIFLNEARQDFLQGIDVPLDQPSEERKNEGYDAFKRYGCKMATGSGKTTVMGMLSAWSILNKVNNRQDARYSDVVLIICPNVTIKNRLAELNPDLGEASLYRTRDLVPSHLMSQLTQGRVLVTNWHVFEPHGIQAGGISAKVNRSGRSIRVRETIHIGTKTATVRGRRYITLIDLEKQIRAGMLDIILERKDRQGNLSKVEVESVRYIESDNAVVQRILGKEIGSKKNILIMDDEAHHAYRIRRPEADIGEEDIFGEEEEIEEYFKEATIWIDGLDRINKLRKINFCIDLSATPYYLGRAGQDTNRIFSWVVSDFGLVDAIESGLTKIPQLAVRDTTGSSIPGYFNIWKWILPKLTSAERGGKKGIAKPEAILKYANVPIAMMAGLWEELRTVWSDNPDEHRPPVIIIICKDTKLAKVIYEWIAEDKPPIGIPSAKIFNLVNKNGQANTIRVDSKVVHETDTGESGSNEMRWMRFTLDTVGKTDWPKNKQGISLYPEGFEELAIKLKRPLHPPGSYVRCIVSVGMLTEGWDCNTVTHIVGLRPFMSQLLCEQVVGRGLRRSHYTVNDDGKLSEEIAKIFGVPFEIIPFKENPRGKQEKPSRTWHIHAVPEKSNYEIKFPRVEGYTQSIKNKISINWENIAELKLDPLQIPPEVEMKAGLPSDSGRPSLLGPGQIVNVNLNPYRKGHRLQQLVFDLARDLTSDYVKQPSCEVPAHELFPQIVKIVDHYIKNKVKPISPAKKIDAFLSPYYGWMIERLVQEIKPAGSEGEPLEIPRYESSRGPGSTNDVNYKTRKEPYPIIKCHINGVVPDTKKWEQSAAYQIDKHKAVMAFVKNSGLGFAIPYLHNGQLHEYIPDFIIKLDNELNLILETKGFDELKEVKNQAAHRWVEAVNTEGSFGEWDYCLVESIGDTAKIIDQFI
ncbi:MAG: DEAD/DEAH box helicase family protein [Proteobacteria bacterium]|nr:DEAD/DEAH box helicase family protein [Pseudomonadota bacterium]